MPSKGAVLRLAIKLLSPALLNLREGFDERAFELGPILYDHHATGRRALHLHSRQGWHRHCVVQNYSVHWLQRRARREATLHACRTLDLRIKNAQRRDRTGL